MPPEPQSNRAEAFHALHSAGSMLVLCNAWDAASARIIEAEGFPAIATTSGGIAWSHGYSDGSLLSRDEMVSAIRRVVRVLSVPLSTDIESGYGSTPDEVGETIRQVIDAGAVGVNLEDGFDRKAKKLNSAERHADIIRAAREAAAKTGIRLFINARTDVYLHPEGPPESRFAEALRRLRLFQDAGADGLFVPGLTDRKEIAGLLAEFKLPLNLYAHPQTPPVDELQRLGVRRLSVGSGPAMKSFATTRQIARDLRAGKPFSHFLDGALTMAEIRTLFRG